MKFDPLDALKSILGMRRGNLKTQPSNFNQMGKTDKSKAHPVFRAVFSRNARA